MDENLICECGNENFWFFWGYVRCTKCFNEYKRVMTEFHQHSFGGGGSGYPDLTPEFLMRRFNKEKNQYYNNWEHYPKTLNKKK